MRAGRLRHRITLQSPAGSRDAVGERVTTWNNVVTGWPAAIEPLTQKQRFAAAQEHGSVTHKIIIRYDSLIAGIDYSWRVLYRARIFVINGPPINRDERNRMIEILCEEGLREE